MKRCLVIGYRGQDGRLLTNQLERDGHKVMGLGNGDLELADAELVREYMAATKPDEIYYLAAFHHSSEDRIEVDDSALFRRSFDVHLHGLVSFLECMRNAHLNARIFYAASSHVFGQPEVMPQTEETPFLPRNIYGISKSAGIAACRFYRREYGVHAACGILYNHESAYRAEKFVSQKIIRGALAISRGEQQTLTLGNLDSEIDWGYAPESVDAMVRILAQETPDDFIIATGETHSVREFVEVVFAELGLNWAAHVRANPALITKPTSKLIGDAGRLFAATGWKPTISFPAMVRLLLKLQNDER